MPRLTAEQRERAFGIIQLGARHAHVARIFNCTRTTITRLQTRLRQTGTTADRPKSGRLRVTTPTEDQYLRTIHLRNRFVTVTSTAATALHHVVSRRTVSRRLRRHGILAYSPFRGMTLTSQDRRNCFQWSRRLQHWQNRNWQRILFMDESRFQLYRADGRIRVYR
ncbi:uncharacterized protein [Haliotis asinina]|uniref:uncharacterized protein n=1 Tax=Haliotis asinina TaxID=109174 RepID=UPI003531B47D